MLCVGHPTASTACRIVGGSDARFDRATAAGLALAENFADHDDAVRVAFDEHPFVEFTSDFVV
jgi:hypothetical protein